VRVNPKTIDDKSFAEVTVMDRGRDQGWVGNVASRLGDRIGPGHFGIYGDKLNQG
jgi:hypothetical protein